MPDKSKVDGALGNHLRPVRVVPGHEEGRDVGHVAGGGLELRLAVDGPAGQPLRVARGHNTARYHAAGERVSAADVLNLRENLGVIGIDGGAHPVGLLGVTAEHDGVAKRAIRGLCGDAAPHVPAAARANLRIDLGHGVLRAPRGILDATAVGDVDLVVLGEGNALLGAVTLNHNGPRDLFGRLGGERGHRDLVEGVAPNEPLESEGKLHFGIFSWHAQRLSTLVTCENRNMPVLYSTATGGQAAKPGPPGLKEAPLGRLPRSSINIGSQWCSMK